MRYQGHCHLTKLACLIPIVGDVWIGLARQVPELDQYRLNKRALFLALLELAFVLLHESAELSLLRSLLKL